MNEAGVLGRFVPEFGRVVAMMQFNMYHHYTVDEHLMRTSAVPVRRSSAANSAAELPLSTAIYQHDAEPTGAVRRSIPARHRQGP